MSVLMSQWTQHVDCLHTRDLSEQLAIPPEKESLSDCVVVACRFGILAADLSGPLVRT